MERYILHIHIPSFPIAVERVSRPELRWRPVAVAPLHSERAPILSVSSEARREGVFKGMALGKAMKFCPGLVVIPPNPALTEKAYGLLTGAAARYTPVWEPSRPGHIYMDMTGTERLWGRAKDTANLLGREIRDRLRLSGSVGVAGNKMVSSIASRMLPSEGVLDVDHGQESRFMAPLKVDVLPGIGHVRKGRLLEELNISLVREIAAMDLGRLRLIFGRQACVIHQRAVGVDPTPVYPPPVKPRVSEEAVLLRDENDDEKLLAVLYRLVEKCSHRLRARGLVPGGAGLMFRYADQMEVTCRIPLPGRSFWDFDLYGPLEEALLKACRRRVRVGFMRVWFQDLSRPEAQLSLFDKPLPSGEKRTRVIQTLDRIRERYGDDAIRCGKGL
ncbi:MAG: DNA polymerase IV [Pseudomonadota bacterium]